MKNKLGFLIKVLLFAAVLPSPLYACDPCTLYNSSKIKGHSSGAVSLFVSEQYTDYARGDEEGGFSHSEGEVVRGFSTTQVGVGYDLSDRAGVHLSLPIIGRRFDEEAHEGVTTKSDGGIGDISLVGTYSFLNYTESDWTVIGGASGGVKFPTGDTGVISDAAESEESHHISSKHHPVSTASHGRVLTFGSGSYDYITGLDFLARYQRFLSLSNVQYTIRTEGDYNYEFADDLLWSAGGGYYLILGDHFSLAGLVTLSGEHKGKDKLSGEKLGGSDLSNLYLGPTFLLAFGESTGAELSMGFRVTDEDSSASIVPQRRLIAAISHRF